jgi:Domain of unknown function (DUF4294)
MIRILLIISVLLAAQFSLSAQQTPRPSRPDTTQRGGWVYREVVGGDTLYNAVMRVYNIFGKRTYKSDAERKELMRYRLRAQKVYKYAIQAIELYESSMEETQDMSRRKKRRYLRDRKDEFKGAFEEELKNLSRDQGYMLIKMIERQTGKTCYDIIQDTRGTLTASYWNSASKLWGYDLKEGYIKGKDPLLDEVLLDYDFGQAIWKY